MTTTTPEKPLDNISGLSPTERETIKNRDIKEVYKETGLQGRELMNQIMNNFHMENKGKLTDTFLSQIGLQIYDIENLLRDDPDIWDRYQKYNVSLTGKELSLSDKGIALVQALAEDCVKNIPMGPVKDLLLHTEYFSSHKDIDGYMGPNTTLLLSEIAKADFGKDNGPLPFDGTISPALVAKMYKQCHPEFLPTNGEQRLTPEQKEKKEQSNLNQKKVLETILAELDKLPDDTVSLPVQESRQEALRNVFGTVPTTLSKQQRIDIQSQWNYFDAMENVKERNALESLQNYTLEVQEGSIVLSGFELLKNNGKNEVEKVSPVAADGTAYTLRVINKNMPQPAAGVDQKLFQIQFKADGKTPVEMEYSSSIEDSNADGLGDYIYSIDNVSDNVKGKIIMYRTSSLPTVTETQDITQAPVENTNRFGEYLNKSSMKKLDNMFQEAAQNKIKSLLSGTEDYKKFMENMRKIFWSHTDITESTLKTTTPKELSEKMYSAYAELAQNNDLLNKLGFWLIVRETLHDNENLQYNPYFNSFLTDEDRQAVFSSGEGQSGDNEERKNFIQVINAARDGLTSAKDKINSFKDVMDVYNLSLDKAYQEANK